MRSDDVPRLGPGFTLAEAIHLQLLAGNPLDAEQLAMFEMFEREGWSGEQRRRHILSRALSHGTVGDRP